MKQLIGHLISASTYITAILLIFFSSLDTSDATVCLSCSRVQLARSCTTVETCFSNSHCFIELDVSSAGNIYYKMGCKDKLFCHTHHRRRSKLTSNTTFPHERGERAAIACQECCTGDLCNAAGCTATGYTATRGPICYACAQHKSQDACYQIKVCGRDEFCSIERHQYGADVFYTSGCMTHSMCSAPTRFHSAPIVGRDINGLVSSQKFNNIAGKNESRWVNSSARYQRGTSFPSRICCATDLCNHNGSLGPVVINGAWSAWSSWSSCSVTCNTGHKTRSRTCSNPAPSNGGSYCSGAAIQTHICTLANCPIDGEWSDWGTWSSCSVTCGSAQRSRSRSCSNPAPQYGGKPCAGSDIVRGACSLPSCSATSTRKTHTCLSCSAAASPRDCNFVQQCGPNSVCFLEKHLTTGGYFTFYSGCRDRQFCQVSGVGKRREEPNTYYLNTSAVVEDVEDAINNDKTMCTECCDGDLCNNKGCGEPGYPATQGPVCYKCDQQAHPHHCNEITICNANEACHLTHRVMVGVIYSTGCAKKSDCTAKGYLNTMPVAGVIGRRDVGYLNLSDSAQNHFDNATYRDKRGVTPCSKCCTSNLCNKDTCQNVIHPTTQIHFTTAPTSGTKVTPNHVTRTSSSNTHSQYFTSKQSRGTTPTSHTLTSHSSKITSHTHHHMTTKPHHTITKATHAITTVTPAMTSHGHSGGHVQGHIVNTCQQWGAWTQWSDCNEHRVQLIGYAERTRQCSDGNFDLDKHYCGQYTTSACVPPSIDEIEVTLGNWTTGDAVNIECKVRGHPTPTIKWKCTNNCGTLSDLFEYDYSIFASNLDSRYSGTYTCIASNQCGTVVKDYTTTVT